LLLRRAISIAVVVVIEQIARKKKACKSKITKNVNFNKIKNMIFGYTLPFRLAEADADNAELAPKSARLAPTESTNPWTLSWTFSLASRSSPATTADATLAKSLSLMTLLLFSS